MTNLQVDFGRIWTKMQNKASKNNLNKADYTIKIMCRLYKNKKQVMSNWFFKSICNEIHYLNPVPVLI